MSGERFNLDTLAEEWLAMFRNLLEEKKTNPMIPYQPTKAYQLIGTTPEAIRQELANRKETVVKLNIACGPNVFPYDGWLNIDKYGFSDYYDFLKRTPNANGMPEHQAKLKAWMDQGGKLDFLTHDMTKPFQFQPDNSVDFIYVGQAIEHLNPVYQGPAFLKECHRMLKPGGVLRMTTPDLKKLLEYYHAGNLNLLSKDQPDFYKTAFDDERLCFLLFGASGPDCTQEKYEGHFFCYSSLSMTNALEKAGFTLINFTPPPRPEIRDEGLSHSLVVEATK